MYPVLTQSAIADNLPVLTLCGPLFILAVRCRLHPTSYLSAFLKRCTGHSDRPCDKGYPWPRKLVVMAEDTKAMGKDPKFLCGVAVSVYQNSGTVVYAAP